MASVFDYIKKRYVPEKNVLYNKIIDIVLKTKTGQKIEIKTPRTGRKPRISISGELGMKRNASDFEVRITNFYSNSVISGVTQIEVYAGYSNKVSFALSGSVQAVYTENPGPDKETVLKCITALYDTWLDTVGMIDLLPGFTVSTFLTKVSALLSFDPPEIDIAAKNIVINAPFYHNGRIVDAIAKFKKLIPNLSVSPIGTKLHAFITKNAGSVSTVHILNNLSQSPQFSGGIVNIVLPWQPTIRPGDTVKFSTSSSKMSYGALSFQSATVNSIHFDFSTVESTNQMTITGTPRDL